MTVSYDHFFSPITSEGSWVTTNQVFSVWCDYNSICKGKPFVFKWNQDTMSSFVNFSVFYISWLLNLLSEPQTMSVAWTFNPYFMNFLISMLTWHRGGHIIFIAVLNETLVIVRSFNTTVLFLITDEPLQFINRILSRTCAIVNW